MVVNMYCRFCDITDSHWTSKCPNKSTIQHHSTSRPPDNNKIRVQIRVSNLPDNITRPDLYDLFCPFGAISRTYIAYDRYTHISRGFAFITYQLYDNALSAVNQMNLYVLHDRILNVTMVNNNNE